MPAISNPEAYLLTFTTYGTWLHGDARGSVARGSSGISHRLGPDRQRERLDRSLLASAPFLLSPEARDRCTKTIREVALFRRWELLAVNVRTNHVHVVVRAPVPPEKAMSDFKAWCTRRLREHGLAESSQSIWTRHGSTRYLFAPAAVVAACRYVIEEQGVGLGSGAATEW